MPFPRLYAIVDANILALRSLEPGPFAAELHAAGIRLVQYRNKSGNARRMLDDAEKLKNLFAGNDPRLIFNDRADLALLSGFDGVHVGQDDLRAEDARKIVGSRAWVGVSTHSPQQVVAANRTDCDYIAYGPIFSTVTKDNPDPTVGLDGLRRARASTEKPLVAIGGITQQNCRSVLDAGADSVAVISGLLPASGDRNAPGARQIAERFLTLLGG